MSGFIIGEAEHLGNDNKQYPICKWVSKPSKVIIKKSDVFVMNDEKFTPSIADKLGMKINSIEIWGGPEKEIKKLNTGDE